ncbi:MAG TPA: ATP synthase F1 subunit gamma [Candidatus Acidoferrales bacterium]|nr:ATP synthase F1 subunit gamma [Candidatus Acidoferrales bacterium]
MPTLLDYRRRIRSVKNTQQITRALKFVSAAKLRRAQEAVFRARPYAKEIRRVLQSAMQRVSEPQHALLEQRPEERILLFVVTADKGLSGPFSANVLRRTFEYRREFTGKELQTIAVGRKGVEALKRRKWTLAAEFLNVSMHVEFQHAEKICQRISELYASREVDAVYAIYNEFKSVMVQRLRLEKILPLKKEILASEESATADTHREGVKKTESQRLAESVDYIYEEPPEEIFAKLVPRYLENEVFRILLESAAAEHAARMTAMDAATTNAGELIRDLTLDMNKIRQASITKEIIEIVSGASFAASS